MTTRPIRAALYARVSTVNHGQDIGLQLDELRQVARSTGCDARRRRLSPRGHRDETKPVRQCHV